MMLNRGVLYALGAYLIWGFLPVFWKSLSSVQSSEILGHRILWSLAFLVLINAYRKQWRWLRMALGNRNMSGPHLLSAGLLGINWFTYIWAVNAGFIVETSLGYFINPLVNVMLGVLFLRETIRGWQWVAIAVAAIGVAWLTISVGYLPWIALTLALTFALYGLVRKQAALDALEGLSLEMGILVVPAVAYLTYLGFTGTATLGAADPFTKVLLVLSGVVTAIPLLLFSAGARRIKLATLGILQYVAPTFQFLLGVFVYGEPFSQDRLVGFTLIWLALLVYSVDGISHARRKTSLTYVG